MGRGSEKLRVTNKELMIRTRELILQFCKFGLVGILCFCIDYGFMIFLKEVVAMSYFLSSGISFSVSVLVNYILSMRFVFQGKQDMSKWQEIAIFTVLSVIGLVFNQIIMYLLVEFFAIFYAIAKIFATMTVTIFNFISRKIYLE